ncbi:MAG: D-alanyl-D-alanine carboxypeptidase DacF [Syntrophomonadaceae bacterium]|nr:D-alanyl-D-alanine carboxypeptidase DacF [Bacillota bacterium]
MFRKISCCLLAAMLLTVLASPACLRAERQRQAADAPEFAFLAKAALLMDTGSRQLLYAENIHERVYPASITKVMTMLLAMEALAAGKVNLQEMVNISEEAARLGGAQLFLAPGDRVSVQDLLIGVGVGSANDAAVALAEHLSGTGEAFVLEMNRKAAALGMINSRFVNPHGLHDDSHYTTAYDIALMSLELLRHPKIHEWLTIWMDEQFLKGKIRKQEGVFLSNSNRLIRFYQGADGLKTGYTAAAGSCVAATAKRGETRLLAVMMGAPERSVLFDQTRKLLDYGFANYVSLPVVHKGQAVASLAVDKGQQESVELVAADNLALLLRKGEKAAFNRKITVPERLPAPLFAGREVGFLLAEGKDGTELGRVALVPARDVARASYFDFLRRFLERWIRFGR